MALPKQAKDLPVITSEQVLVTAAVEELPSLEELFVEAWRNAKKLLGRCHHWTTTMEVTCMEEALVA